MKRLIGVSSALLLLPLATVSTLQAATGVDPGVGATITSPITSPITRPPIPTPGPVPVPVPIPFPTPGPVPVPPPIPEPPPGLGLNCGSNLMTGCVGECGGDFHTALTVSKRDVARSLGGKYSAAFCLSTLANSLCPNTSAYYQITNNGEVVAEGSVSESQPALVTGQVGDVIEVDVRLGSGDPNIICIWQGQTTFGIGYVRWQQ